MEPGACGEFDDGGCFNGVEIDRIEAECRDLVQRTCGAENGGPSCGGSSACYAAELLSTYEPAGCAAALLDSQRFPSCNYSVCEALVVRVCGALDGTGACETATGCSPAQNLYERSLQTDDATEAERALESCRAALEDDVVFYACEANNGQ